MHSVHAAGALHQHAAEIEVGVQGALPAADRRVAAAQRYHALDGVIRPKNSRLLHGYDGGVVHGGGAVLEAIVIVQVIVQVVRRSGGGAYCLRRGPTKWNGVKECDVLEQTFCIEAWRSMKSNDNKNNLRPENDETKSADKQPAKQVLATYCVNSS